MLLLHFLAKWQPCEFIPCSQSIAEARCPNITWGADASLMHFSPRIIEPHEAFHNKTQKVAGKFH